MKEKTLFFHTPYNKGFFRYTVAGVSVDGVLYLAIAKCSKKDEFSRKIGRKITSGRLEEGIKDPELYNSKNRKKFCYIPDFNLNNGDRGFGKAFEEKAVFVINQLDNKWRKVDMLSLRESRKTNKRVEAKIRVMETY